MEQPHENHFMFVETHPTWVRWSHLDTDWDADATPEPYELTSSGMETMRFHMKYDHPALYNVTIWLDPDLEISGNPTCAQLQQLMSTAWHLDRVQPPPDTKQPDFMYNVTD